MNWKDGQIGRHKGNSKLYKVSITQDPVNKTLFMIARLLESQNETIHMHELVFINDLMPLGELDEIIYT